jgi:hypothetical protein
MPDSRGFLREFGIFMQYSVTLECCDFQLDSRLLIAGLLPLALPAFFPDSSPLRGTAVAHQLQRAGRKLHLRADACSASF